ncbi:DUF3782 domain-containing protein [Pyrobaculum neutrophilum]|uniref:DUF3782 domain-containing protein n=1 Tax=Pyrobaculum neutrophilum (strain DSM 2338 / JCM 9278 / NBRC 100436 / V24Sta) TaxID=444157 RepID=B1YDZ0_PYRNV|nr:Protein of unknown function DUF1626 [Pyrobaculum neutrophilum V24Sta]
MVEEVRRVLLEHPEIIAEAIEARPEVLYRALARLTPWQNLATKEDVRSLREEMQKIEEKMATKDDLKHLATKDDVSRLEDRLEETRREMATKEEVKTLEAKMATKDDIKAFATKEDLKTLEARVATKEDLKALATREELRALEAKMATKDDIKDLEARMATREDVRRLEEQVGEVRRVMVTKDEHVAFEKRIMAYVNALGARWGVVSEDVYREGVRELLRDAGYTVERWVYYDGEGYVYGYPAEVELDVVAKDGKTIAVELTAALKRGDLQYIKKKAELYQRTAGRPLDRVIVVTPFIHDRNPDLVRAKAKEYGIDIVAPGDL